MKFFLVTLWFLLSYTEVAPSVGARPLFDSWTVDNGLPQNSVNAILQTRDGYLWFATNGGLARYDGVRFTVFDVANSAGLKSNRLTALYEDPAGVLWIGSEESGLIRYRDGAFTTFTVKDGLPGNWILAIEGDERGGGLLVLTDEGIARWEGEHFTVALTRTAAPMSPDAWQRSPLKGSFAFHDHAGLYRFTDGRLVKYTTKDGLSSTRINTVYRDQHGTLWIATKDRGIDRLKDGVFTNFSVADGLPSNNIMAGAVCEDSRGNIWFAAGDAGLIRLKNGKLRAYTAAEGLPTINLGDIYEDREGSIWIGTSDAGLYRFREEVVTAYTERDGLSANNIYPIYEDRAGCVWIGAWPGLNKYQDGVITRVLGQGAQPSILVSAIHEDAEGSLWFGIRGGGSGGLIRLKDGKFTEYSTRDGLAANAVLAIHQDRAGALWFGTTGGLNRYRDGTLTTYTTNDGLAGNEVKIIYEDHAGTLWIGGVGGLTKFTDGRFVAYTERQGLSGQHVRAIHEDRDGVLWVGTYEGGLNRFKDGRFTRYTMRDGLFDNGVFQILDDGRGNFWMSSNRGIYRVSRRELDDFAGGKIRTITSVSYGKDDGMLNVECNGGSSPAGVRTRDGRLWFPTQEGVAVIDLAAIKPNELPPPVHIEGFVLDNQEVGFGGGEVLIQPGQERFEIRYTGLSFIKPERVRFKYKLEGLDEDWVNAGNRRTANYSYVPPGSYTFRVTAANSDGVWNTEGASVNVIVYPPFWRTWWFLSLSAGSLIGIAIGIAILAHKRRVRQLKRAHDAQEAFSRQLIASQERERQRVASELHDGLGQSLVIIKNRALLGLRATAGEYEKAREQLGEISAATSQAIGEMKEIAYDLRPYQLDRLGLTKAIAAMLKRAENSSGIIFSAELDRIDGLCPKDGEINLYRIMQEAVNNIVKHARATEARVLIKREAGRVRITIQDNGQGFSHESNGGAEARGDDHHGFGLIGIAERVQILGGEHEIQSVPGSGTTITIKLNLQDG